MSWVSVTDRAEVERPAEVMVIDSYRGPEGMPHGVAVVVAFPPSAQYVDVVFPHDTQHWLGHTVAPPLRVWTVRTDALLRRMNARELVAYMTECAQRRARWVEEDWLDD